jgi:hypothetical protein
MRFTLTGELATDGDMWCSHFDVTFSQNANRPGTDEEKAAIVDAFLQKIHDDPDYEFVYTPYRAVSRSARELWEPAPPPPANT